MYFQRNEDKKIDHETYKAYPDAGGLALEKN